mmetsp:Transcript_2807/g.4305  ORF Transcript_2807/g.4305 Transcript_2807/m.4305 type:complete len:570 (-) Transcript_2807:228-1937(-)
MRAMAVVGRVAQLHVVIMTLLMQLMALQGIRVRQAMGEQNNTADAILSETIAPQPETQIVDVAWDGYCGSKELESSSGKPTVAGRLCRCGETESWVMKKRNGYKKGTFPTIGISEFLGRLKLVLPNYILEGAVNGWHALRDAKVVSIKCRKGDTIEEIWAHTVRLTPRDAVSDHYDQCDEAPRATLFTESRVKFHSQLLPDDYCQTHKDPLVCTDATCSFKPMRPTPSVELSTLERDLKIVDSGTGLVYKPAPNGWPAFANLPAIITCKDGTHVDFDDDFDAGLSLWAKPSDCRPRHVTLQLPEWMLKGWSESAEGFVWRFTPKIIDGTGDVIHSADLSVGTDILKSASSDKLIKKVYAFAHRYTPEGWSWRLDKTIRDMLTYHAAVFIEWQDASYGTIVELAWQNGIGGYKGKSNWYADKNARETELFRTMLEKVPTMVRPWHNDRHELRINDIPIATHEEFVKFMDDYSKPGPEQRFFDVHGYKNKKMASPALFGRNTEKQLYQALLNYNKNSGGSYSEVAMNCQTFQADLFTWLTGKDTSVFVDALKIPAAFIMKYQQHTEWFEPN